MGSKELTEDLDGNNKRPKKGEGGGLRWEGAPLAQVGD